MNEFYTQRHFKLWEDNNRLLNRVVFLTVVISLTLVIKVLAPFVSFSEEKIPVHQAVESLNQEKAIVAEKLAYIEKTAGVLKEVNGFIARESWQKKKRELIQRFQRMRNGYSKEQYQQEADATIKQIAEELHKQVISPLQQSIDTIENKSARPEKLMRKITSLSDFIEDWQKEFIGRNWYQTINRKDRTMYELTAQLDDRLRELSWTVKSELKSIKQQRKKVDKELSLLSKKIAAEAQKLQELDDKLQKVLPEWLRGFINIEQVIQLLPAVLLSAAILIVILGLGLTRHYKIYIKNQNIGMDITTEPGMSSIWTLIYRGGTGTLLTIAAYTLFIVFSWVLYERAMQLLLNWLMIDPAPAWISSITFWESLRLAGHGGFILLLVFFFIKLKSLLASS